MRSPKPRIFELTLALVPAIASALILVAGAPAHAEPWAKHAGKLPLMQRQVENMEHEIKEMIEHKRHVEDPKTVHEILKGISAKHKELQKLFKTYEEERSHVRFRHPDKADEVERQYTRHEVKSLEDLEGELGLDGKLDRIKQRVLSTFPSDETARRQAARDAAREARKPAAAHVEDDAIEKVHLSK